MIQRTKSTDSLNWPCSVDINEVRLMCANSQLPDLTHLVNIILLSACREFDGKDQRRERAGGKEQKEERGKKNSGFFTEIIYTSGV